MTPACETKESEDKLNTLQDKGMQVEDPVLRLFPLLRKSTYFDESFNLVQDHRLAENAENESTSAVHCC